LNTQNSHLHVSTFFNIFVCIPYYIQAPDWRPSFQVGVDWFVVPWFWGQLALNFCIPCFQYSLRLSVSSFT